MLTGSNVSVKSVSQEESSEYWEKILQQDRLAVRRPSKEIPTDPSILDYLGKDDEYPSIRPIHQEVEDAIENLPDDERELIYLRYYEGLSLRRIANRMGYNTHGTAAWRIKRALNRVSRSLNGYQ